MDIRTLSALGILVTLAGCANTNFWNHPTNDEAQFAQDRYTCNEDGEQHAVNANRAVECMRAQGYTVTKARIVAGSPPELPTRATPDEI